MTTIVYQVISKEELKETLSEVLKENEKRNVKEELLTVNKAAKILKKSPVTVKKYVQQGKFDVNINGEITRKSLERYLEAVN